MTVSLLLQNLAGHLRGILETYHTAQGAVSGSMDGEYKQVNVFEWYAPLPDKERKESDFPFIEVRPVTGKSNRLQSQAKIELTFGVFSRAGDGPNGVKVMDGGYDLMNLMEHVEIELLKNPVIKDRFRMQPEYEWSIPEEQPYPYFVGTAITHWDMPKVINEKGAIKAYG